MTNLRPGAYRDVSVATVDFPLTAENLTRHFLGRECYRRTRYLVVRNGVESALIAVEPSDPEPLFSPAAAVDVLALPARPCTWNAPASTPGCRRRWPRWPPNTRGRGPSWSRAGTRT